MFEQWRAAARTASIRGYLGSGSQGGPLAPIAHGAPTWHGPLLRQRPDRAEAEGELGPAVLRPQEKISQLTLRGLQLQPKTYHHPNT